MDRAVSVMENTCETSPVEHCCLEPDSAVGYMDWDGTIVIVASTQNPHYDQKEVADLLGIDENRVRVIQAPTGDL